MASGQAPNVRAALAGAPFSPGRLSGCVLWLKADSLSFADGTAIATWPDLSGAGHDIIQATGSKQPLFKVAILNGWPVIRFDVTDDALANAAFSMVSPEHVFLVFKYNQAASGTQQAMEGSAANTLKLARTATGTLSISAGTTLTLTGNTPESFHFYSLEFNGASSSIRVDENANSISGNAGTASTSGFTLNSNSPQTLNFAGMDVAEVVIYTRILSQSERLQVENYFVRKYALTLTP